jgi:hypothetical protein
MTRISLTSFCIGALLVGSSSLAWGETATAQISADETVEFDIPEQDLAPALTQVGIQSQREIIFADNIARGQTASGLQQRMTPEHAVDVLLVGTGLNARVNRVGTITISAEDQAAPDAPEGGSDATASEPVETLSIHRPGRMKQENDLNPFRVRTDLKGSTQWSRHAAHFSPTP